MGPNPERAEWSSKITRVPQQIKTVEIVRRIVAYIIRLHSTIEAVMCRWLSEVLRHVSAMLFAYWPGDQGSHTVEAAMSKAESLFPKGYNICGDSPPDETTIVQYSSSEDVRTYPVFTHGCVLQGAWKQHDSAVVQRINSVLMTKIGINKVAAPGMLCIILEAEKEAARLAAVRGSDSMLRQMSVEAWKMKTQTTFRDTYFENTNEQINKIYTISSVNRYSLEYNKIVVAILTASPLATVVLSLAIYDAIRSTTVLGKTIVPSTIPMMAALRVPDSLYRSTNVRRIAKYFLDDILKSTGPPRYIQLNDRDAQEASREVGGAMCAWFTQLVRHVFAMLLSNSSEFRRPSQNDSMPAASAIQLAEQLFPTSYDICGGKPIPLENKYKLTASEQQFWPGNNNEAQKWPMAA
eukprot:GHVQ01010698.1.p1 GENE.GHVQ01010698.1~~GHVQ01010698.1.p1  ORF type:complete len:434 (+),score=36.35 GHVQ01010698.1:79-1302(+)